jgi:hypothetical protein
MKKERPGVFRDALFYFVEIMNFHRTITLKCQFDT